MTHMGEERDACGVLVWETQKERELLEDLDIDGKITLKFIIK